MKVRFWSRFPLLLLFLVAAVTWTLQRALDDPEFTFAEPASTIDGLGAGKSEAVRIAALGDVRSGDSRQAKIAQLLDRIHRQAPLDGVILLGDNTLLRGAPERALEKTFSIPYASLIKQGVPFHAVLGNHDLRKGMKRYQLYFPGFNMNGRPYYSKTFGESVDVFFLDSNKIENDPEQVAWLEQALDQSAAHWKVVAMHHPLYSSANHHPAEQQVAELLEPIFARNGVDLVVSGHNHIYERLHPVNGITYITSGSGGELRKGDLNRKSPLLAAGNDEDNVALVLEFAADTCTSLAYTADGKLIDKATIANATARASD